MNIILFKTNEYLINEKIYEELRNNAENLNIDEIEIKQIRNFLDSGAKVSLTEVRSICEKNREVYIILNNEEQVGYAILIDLGEYLEIDIHIFHEYQRKGVLKDLMPKILMLYPERDWILHVYKFNQAWKGIKKIAELNGFIYHEDPYSLDHKMIKKANLMKSVGANEITYKW